MTLVLTFDEVLDALETREYEVLEEQTEQCWIACETDHMWDEHDAQEVLYGLVDKADFERDQRMWVDPVYIANQRLMWDIEAHSPFVVPDDYYDTHESCYAQPEDIGGGE